MTESGRSITVFLAHGDPNGIRFAKEPGNTMRAVAFRRDQLSQFKEISRDNIGFPGIDRRGVYILIGEHEESGHFQVYVGKGDVGSRLRRHGGSNGKSFWRDTVVIVSTGSDLTLDIAEYAEAKLIEAISVNSRWSLSTNVQHPTCDERLFSASVLSTAKQFVDRAKMLVGTLGYGMFRETRKGGAGSHSVKPVVELAGEEEKQESESGVTPLFVLKSGEGWCDARMVVVSGGFLVRAGSKARGEERASIRESYKRKREELLANGTLRDEGEFLVFLKDYEFSSPSAAAIFVTGRSANGRREWKLPNGQTLGEWMKESSKKNPNRFGEKSIKPVVEAAGEKRQRENERKLSPLFLLKSQEGWYDATMVVVSGGFVVKAGSKARGDESAWIPDSIKRSREELLADGILKREDEFLVFLKDCRFRSPSAAAGVVTGRSTSGPREWKLPNGQTFGEWKKESSKKNLNR